MYSIVSPLFFANCEIIARNFKFIYRGNCSRHYPFLRANFETSKAQTVNKIISSYLVYVNYMVVSILFLVNKAYHLSTEVTTMPTHIHSLPPKAKLRIRRRRKRSDHNSGGDGKTRHQAQVSYIYRKY